LIIADDAYTVIDVVGTGCDCALQPLAVTTKTIPAAIVRSNRPRIGDDHTDSAPANETHTGMSCCALASRHLRIGLRSSHKPSPGGRLEHVGKVGGVVRQTTTVSEPRMRLAVGDTTRPAEDDRLSSRAGQGLLMVEGLVIGVLGGVALAWSMGYTRFGADGIPMLGLKVTPPHAGLLLVVGTLALLSCLGPRAALVFSALTALGWATLTFVCASNVAHHAPGVLGFDPRDSFVYGVLSAYNLVTSVLLALALFKYRREV
jgi:hypothetical protein